MLAWATQTSSQTKQNKTTPKKPLKQELQIKRHSLPILFGHILSVMRQGSLKDAEDRALPEGQGPESPGTWGHLQMPAESPRAVGTDTG